MWLYKRGTIVWSASLYVGTCTEISVLVVIDTECIRLGRRNTYNHMITVMAATLRKNRNNFYNSAINRAVSNPIKRRIRSNNQPITVHHLISQSILRFDMTDQFPRIPNNITVEPKDKYTTDGLILYCCIYYYHLDIISSHSHI